MVVLETRANEHELQMDLVFNALSSQTRRDIVRRAMSGEDSVSDLARSYSMSFAAVQKHVAVLERAGLVTKRRQGREQLVRTEIERVHIAQELLDQFETLWRDRLDRFTTVLAHQTEGDLS